MVSRTFEEVLKEQDMQFVRVLEDLIEILMEEGIVSLDKFPDRAAEKIMIRRRMRNIAAEI